MDKNQRFKIHFAYTQLVKGRKVLRDKTHIYEAPNGNAAIKIVERLYGKVKIWRIERQ